MLKMLEEWGSEWMWEKFQLTEEDGFLEEVSHCRNGRLRMALTLRSSYKCQLSSLHSGMQ